MNDQYAAVRKQRLCYGCLGKEHAIKDCKVNACGFNGRIQKHNRLLYSEKQLNEGNHAVNVSAAIINMGNEAQKSTGLIGFSVFVLNFVDVLKEYIQIGDLQSSSTLYLAVDKLPQVLKEKWWIYNDDKDEDRPDLIMSEKWLSRMAFVHEGFSAFK